MLLTFKPCLTKDFDHVVDKDFGTLFIVKQCEPVNTFQFAF